MVHKVEKIKVQFLKSLNNYEKRTYKKHTNIKKSASAYTSTLIRVVISSVWNRWEQLEIWLISDQQDVC